MNLLNEIQETTLMMNLYQQQQLQQQQQQLQQQASVEHLGANGSSDQLSLLIQQQNGVGNQSIDSMFASGQLGQHRTSLGLGGTSQLGGFGGSNGLTANMRGGLHDVSLSNNMQGQLQQNNHSSVHQQVSNAQLNGKTENTVPNQPVPTVIGSDGASVTAKKSNGKKKPESSDKKRCKDADDSSGDRPSPKRSKSDEASQKNMKQET